MREIRKYANGRLYDTENKKYLNKEELQELIASGEPFQVIVSKTGDDITAETVAKAAQSAEPKAMEKEQGKKPEDTETGGEDGGRQEEAFREEDAESFLFRMFKKGGGTFTDYTRRSAKLFQSAVTMAEEELDKRIKQLVKGKELTETEAKRLKDETIGFSRNVKNWMGAYIEKRINDVLGAMNLASKEQMDALSAQIEELGKKVEAMERMEKEREDNEAQVEISPE